MSYQVLARKWRPRIFREMVGQEHVLQALINALDHNRLHHAYLFTGTRGVGKTTIARILAKCLNCETGVSSEPCGQCSACREIAEGRFVDLIEVDAASRTKVEDTRELLENVQYAPTRGRYKVYLIDEVHMLSNSSFNALLKTLEEPPPHVKFLLATTDPQKLPMTILSRCLQFNLKNMHPERIVQHLKFVLEKELVPFEESALWQLGRSADGSMRDAMSLTDQAIAYGSGKITEAEVRTMLGTIDQAAVYEIVTALASLDGKAVLTAVEHMAEHAPDYASALAEMLSVLHRVAIAQALPEAVDNSHGDRERIMQLAQQLPPEDVQLFYQTALLGRRDLPLAPDPRAGFEMVLLRMLAFKPQGVLEVPANALPAGQASSLASTPAPVAAASVPVSEIAAVKNEVPASTESSVTVADTAPDPANPPSGAAATADQGPTVKEVPPFDGPYDNAPADDGYAEYASEPAYYDAPPQLATASQPEVAPPKKPEAAGPLEDEAEQSTEQRAEQSAEQSIEQSIEPVAVDLAPVSTAPQPPVPQPPVSLAAEAVRDEPVVTTRRVQKIPLERASPATWPEIYLGLGVTGILQSTVANCQLVERQGNQFYFVLDQANSTLYDESHQLRLADLLSDYFIEPIKVVVQAGEVTAETPAAIAIRHKQERQENAVASIKNDPIVQQLIKHFDASLREDTIVPLGDF